MSRLRARVPAVSAAAAVLLLIGFSGRASAAIALDNDVTVGWADGEGCLPVKCDAVVVGAPRLLRDLTDARSFSLTITRSHETRADFTGMTLFLHVHAADLKPVCIETGLPGGFGCPLRLRYSQDTGFTVGGQDSLADVISRFPDALPFPLILTLKGTLFGSVVPGIFTVPPATLTLSGGGNEIIIDRVGDDDDFHQGDALDIPARSVQVALALGEIHGDLRQDPGELDASLRPRGDRNRPVSFTHAFNLPDHADIESAMLVLHVRSGASGAFNDFVLLDQGVRIVASHGPGPAVPRIFLRDLLRGPAIPGESYVIQLNLRRVLADLGDRQLNVIVADDTEVDFSDLRIILRNR